MSDFVHDNLSDVIERHKILICLSLVTLIVLGVISTNLFSVLAFIMFALIVVFAKEQFLMCLLLFILPFASLFKLAPEIFSLFTICEILVIIKIFFTKKVSVSVVISALLYFGYLALGTYIRGQVFDTHHIKQFENILMLYSLVLMSKDTPFEKIATYYILGMILSSTVGLYAQSNPIFYDYAKEIYTEGEYTRFCGLAGDPNYYSVNMIFAFVLLLALRKKRKVSVDMFWILYGLLTVFGFMTISKSFMLMYIIIFVVTSMIVLKDKNPIENTLLVVGVIAILTVGLSEGGLISSVLERLTSAGNVNELTTGRSDIWELYLELFRSDPGAIVFGTGLTNTLLQGKGTHNLYLEMVYYLGFAGILLFGLALYFCLKRNNKKENKTWFKRLGWIVLAIMYFFLQALFSYAFMYIVFFAYLIFKTNMNKENNCECFVENDTKIISYGNKETREK